MIIVIFIPQIMSMYLHIHTKCKYKTICHVDVPYAIEKRKSLGHVDHPKKLITLIAFCQ